MGIISAETGHDIGFSYAILFLGYLEHTSSSSFLASPLAIIELDSIDKIPRERISLEHGKGKYGIALPDKVGGCPNFCTGISQIFYAEKKDLEEIVPNALNSLEKIIKRERQRRSSITAAKSALGPMLHVIAEHYTVCIYQLSYQYLIQARMGCFDVEILSSETLSAQIQLTTDGVTDGLGYDCLQHAFKDNEYVEIEGTVEDEGKVRYTLAFVHNVRTINHGMELQERLRKFFNDYQSAIHLRSEAARRLADLGIHDTSEMEADIPVLPQAVRELSEK